MTVWRRAEEEEEEEEEEDDCAVVDQGEQRYETEYIDKVGHGNENPAAPSRSARQTEMVALAGQYTISGDDDVEEKTAEMIKPPTYLPLPNQR
jgi:hypothetical protein